MRDPLCSCFDEYGWYHQDHTMHDPDCRSLKPKTPLETIRDSYAESVRSINFESMGQTSLAEALAQTNRIYSRRQNK